ncbi:hypothetical protein FHS09_002034 [Microbulbifer rhizosphaerae]|uniref:3-keto-alpha-glucoside-1,2-lyase/3-keto-2-hydroxy-glucal hydratase domain-containing protein n=1 Tax=Microbulbifer rhizosphaerae TaxID=1562603 RepID=A0A7W4WBG4_9GAMM|nr:hypothetical protein [Microbulbifer rhizosphaerae]
MLYHCHGDHGAFWNTWMSCLESQVQEKDFGDFITLAGTSARAPFRQDGERSVYDPPRDFAPWRGYLHAAIEPDKPHGEWSRIDLYVVGDRSIHMINGKVVMSLSGALDKNGQLLLGSRLQIQSEAAEVEYKAIRLRLIDAFPPMLEQRAFRRQ